MPKAFRAALPLVTILLTGCVSSEPTMFVPAYEAVTGFDFTKYTEQGFLITPNEYRGEYESRGIIYIESFPAANRSLKVVGKTRSLGDWIFEEKTANEAIERAYLQAVEMGADALVQFEVSASTRSYRVIGDSGMYESVAVPGIEVHGFAIKRMR